MAIPSKRKEELFERFEKGAAPADPMFVVRPISATAGRLIGGAVIVDTMTFLGGLMGQNGTSPLPGMIGCGIGLLIANTAVFGGSDALDRIRWQRYWHGDILGYWISYIPLLFAMIANADSFESPSGLLVGAYVVASAIALVFGFANLLRRDARDKAEIAACLAEWRALPRPI